MTASHLPQTEITHLAEEALADLEAVITGLLPKQGAIEVQYDAPSKRHDWHQHDCDETLVILRGALTFELEGRTLSCQRGDVIYLPKHTKHASQAQNEGAIYLIAQNITCLS